MIIRIVKMQFRKEEREKFLRLFDQRKEKIRGFEGCLHLELLQDINDPCLLWTYSYWQDPQALEAYRQSALFQDTWSKTRSLFAKRAEAWSLERKAMLPGTPFPSPKA